MRKVLPPLWFVLRYLVVMLVFVVVAGLVVLLHEPTPLWTLPIDKNWSPVVLQDDRLLLMGRDETTPPKHFTLRSLTLDGVERSQLHLSLGKCMFDIHSTGILASIIIDEKGIRLIHRNLMQPISNQEVPLPLIAENEPPLLNDSDAPLSGHPIPRDVTSGYINILMSANGKWCSLQVGDTLVLLNDGKLAKVLKQASLAELYAISNDGRRLLFATGTHSYLIDIESRRLIKKLPSSITWITESTVDGRYFVVMEWKPGLGYEVKWLSVETGEIERTVNLPIRGGKKPEWGTQLNLKNGDVACLTSSNATLIPLATEFAQWLETKLGLKLDWKWLKETSSRGAVHLIHQDGSHEQLRLGNNIKSVYQSRDGKHLLAQFDLENGPSYALFQLPLPSPYPSAVLYGMLAALPVLLLQLVWRRTRKSPRLTTTS